ncbi:MAG TPA: aspartate aminotransferase family protein [Nitrospiria bacterium]|nr:aspartate aminotransferase family protein [Nitrospiria bacterium]
MKSKEISRDDQIEDFLRYVCQTSSEPMGIEVDRAEGCRITDRSGKKYLDFISGIGVANLGHAHPAVVKAVGDQAARYLHVMVYGEYIQEPQVRLAKRLAQVVPLPLSVTYFTNSGTEANEGALKTAKKYTKRKKLVAFKGGFHGDSQGSLSVTGREVYRKPFRPLLPDVVFIPFNRLHSLKTIDRRTAAVIVEPIQGEGGVNLPTDDFLPALRQRCNETGALLIFDEVMTGMGRTGKLFASQHWDVVPDILVLAKALGGGMPLGAFVSRPEIMRTLSENPPLSHVTTFGGHPVCCAAGLAALDFLIENKLPERAERLGQYLRDRLNTLSRIGGVKDVRGKGLLIGFELNNANLTKRFATNCRDAGLILGWTLHSNTVVRLAPPLIITEAELDQGLEIMREALSRATNQ